MFCGAGGGGGRGGARIQTLQHPPSTTPLPYLTYNGTGEYFILRDEISNRKREISIDGCDVHILLFSTNLSVSVDDRAPNVHLGIWM